MGESLHPAAQDSRSSIGGIQREDVCISVSVSPYRLSSTEMLQAVQTDLCAKAIELGLVLSAWDKEARQLWCGGTQSDFCQMLQECKAGAGACVKTRQNLARVVLETHQTSRATSPFGCCHVGIPVLERQRLIGAIVVEFPTKNMLDEEHFARLCDRLELDRNVMSGYARQACRYHADEVVHVQETFTMFLRDQQHTQDANQALTSLSMNLADTYEELSLLYHVSSSMKVSQAPVEFLQDVCHQLQDVMGVEVATALVHDPQTKMESDILVNAEDSTIPHEQLRLLAATYILPQLQDASSLLLDNAFDAKTTPGSDIPVRSVLAVPLTIDQENIGMLLALNKEGDFDSHDAKLITSIAGQSSVFLANNRMFAELQDLLVGVLQSLTESLDAKDPYTCGHSRRVAEIAQRLAQELDLEPLRTQQIYLAGLLHDVGKIGVPEAILCKNGRLTKEEYDVIKCHPAIGAKILRRIRNLEPIIAGVLTHHERLDGQGYPNGLADEDVPLEGRIISLADGFDAMTSQRTYRRAMPLDKAIEELHRCAGTQFDPKLVDILLSWDLETFMEELNALNVHDLHIFDERIY